MVRLLPVAIALVAIVALTVVEGVRTGRWVPVDRQTAYCASLLDEIPNKIGSWVGEDDEVESTILVVAGADGFVSRMYRDNVTGRAVNVWLIVGHAHDTAEHTPDSCYPSQGYTQRDASDVYTIELEDQPDANFWTAVFEGGRTGGPPKRVFWAWFRPEEGADQVEWIAPDKARWYFGNTPQLFKLYFTGNAQLEGEDFQLSDSDCVKLAKEFLPVVAPILNKANQPAPDDFTPPEPVEQSTVAAN